MYEDIEDTSEEIEEVRELLYNLLKDYPAGVTSKFLEEQYDKKYVQTGITRPLPKDWLRYAKQTDEFEVKQLSTFTMLYLVTVDSLDSSIAPTSATAVDNSSSIVNNKSNEKSADGATVNPSEPTLVSTGEIEKELEPLPPTINSDLEPMALQSMPMSITVQVHVVFVIDPDNIFIRLCSWDPVPDYLHSALMRVPDTELEAPTEISPGTILAAPVNDVWERVKVVRQSKKFKGYWIVFAIDMGYYHITSETNLRPLSDAVIAFKKIFLARIKLSNIKPVEPITTINNNNNNGLSNLKRPIHWSRSARTFLFDHLMGASSRNIELVAESQWSYDTHLNIPCMEAQLNVNGENLNKLLVEENLAEKRKS